MNNLKELITKRGLTVKQFAELTGIYAPRIYNYITETSRPSRKSAERIADALGCKPDDIFPMRPKAITRLYRTLLEKGVTQMELSKRTGLAFVTVNRAVNGKASEATMCRIAEAIGVKTEEIAESSYDDGTRLLMDEDGKAYILPCFPDAERIVKIIDNAMMPRYEEGALLVCKSAEITNLAEALVVETAMGCVFRYVSSDGDTIFCEPEDRDCRELVMPSSFVKAAWKPVGYIRKE